MPRDTLRQTPACQVRSATRSALPSVNLPQEKLLLFREHLLLIEVLLGVRPVPLTERAQRRGIGARELTCRNRQCRRILRLDEHAATGIAQEPSGLAFGI